MSTLSYHGAEHQLDTTTMLTFQNMYRVVIKHGSSYNAAG